MDWLDFSWGALGRIALAGVVIYAAVIVFTRVAGLRSFSKMSSFDFAMTVAVGSILATVVVDTEPPLVEGVVGLGVLYVLQSVVAKLRLVTAADALVDNTPLLLMDGPTILEANLHGAAITEADLRAKLREANVLRYEQVRAVVLETTGDITVLHGEVGGPPLDADLLRGVRGAEAFSGSS